MALGLRRVLVQQLGRERTGPGQQGTVGGQVGKALQCCARLARTQKLARAPNF